MRQLIILCLALSTIACGAAEPRSRSFIMASTTTLENCGLLSSLSTAFKRDSGIDVRTIVVGSGKALRLAREGEVSLAITHDPVQEANLQSTGQVRLYQQFMSNEFVIVGPAGNGAGVQPGESATTAFARIQRSGSRFCSRNDSSGTHARELQIWKAAGISPRDNPGYMEMGQPMSALLRSANELQAYALTDSATFARLRRSLSLVIVNRGDPMLRNVYAVTLMKPSSAGEDDRYRAAEEFAAWLLSSEGRHAIEAFAIDGVQQFLVFEGSSRRKETSP